MSRLLNHFLNSPHLALAGSVVSFAFLGLGIGNAHAAQKSAIKTEVSSETPSSGAMPISQILPPHEVDVVVVWGFRLRPTEHDLRLQSLRSGYSELVEKAACLNELCGYVVVQSDGKWRATNVISGTERELRDMERNMEREGTTLVIVHPTGQKRSIPNF